MLNINFLNHRTAVASLIFKDALSPVLKYSTIRSH